MALSRRSILTALCATCMSGPAQMMHAQSRLIWSAAETLAALHRDEIRLIDIRSPQEWRMTGVAKGAWPISMHERAFEKRLFAARTLADNRQIALICATGGRTAAVMRALARAKYTGFVDVSEGMLGSKAGPGWVAAGLPVVTLDQALADLPQELA